MLYHLSRKIDSMEESLRGIASRLEERRDRDLGLDPSSRTSPADPLSNLRSWRNRLDDMFEGFLGGAPPFPAWEDLGGTTRHVSDLDIEEKSDRFILRMDLPEGEESVVEVAVEGREVRITGEHGARSPSGGVPGGTRRWTSRQSTFERIFTLPEPADEGGVQISRENGALTIVIPKLHPG